MAKMPPTAAATAPTDTIHRTRDTAAPTPLAAENNTLRERVADLERLLADAQAAITATTGAAALRFPYPVQQAAIAASILGPRMAFAYWDGAVGLQRQTRAFSLFQGLAAANAKLADGTPVHIPAHAMLWLLDTMRMQGEV